MILELLKENRIIINLAAKDYRTAIHALVNRTSVRDEPGIVDAIMSREKLMTTGLGKGAALPRVHTDRLSAPELVIGISPTGLNAGSIDRKPVQIIFLHVFPAGESGAAILGQSLRLLNDDNLRHELVRAPASADILQLIERWEGA